MLKLVTGARPAVALGDDLGCGGSLDGSRGCVTSLMEEGIVVLPDVKVLAYRPSELVRSGCRRNRTHPVLRLR